MNTTDQLFLLKTLSLASLGRGQCAPNPAVGALVVSSAGEILATGYHLGAGNPHAEVEALQKIPSQAQGATIYITLEPCCHWGKTPPCTDALIQAGIKRVVYAYQDPNPIVRGKSTQLLIENGITCDFLPLPEINAFYASYQHWCDTNTPFITAKIALSLDGKIAGKAGERIQITGEALQDLTHLNRKISDAILTTAKTVINDNPQLNARYQDQVISKHLYILDRQLITPPTATIFSTAKSITLFHSQQTSPTQFQQLGIRCVPISEDAEEGLNLTEVIQKIGADGIHDLWIEAGGKCFEAFLQDKLLQRALIYLAPKWLGEGMPAFGADFAIDFSVADSLTWKQVGKEVVLDAHLPSKYR